MLAAAGAPRRLPVPSAGRCAGRGRTSCPPSAMEQWVLWAQDVLGPAAAGGSGDEPGASEARGAPMSASGSGSGAGNSGWDCDWAGDGEESGLVEDEALAALRAGKDEVLGDEDRGHGGG